MCSSYVPASRATHIDDNRHGDIDQKKADEPDRSRPGDELSVHKGGVNLSNQGDFTQSAVTKKGWTPPGVKNRRLIAF